MDYLPTEPTEKRQNIFQSVTDRWYHPDKAVAGAREEDYYNEQEYLKFSKEMDEHGVDDFVDFLHQALCTYPAISTFLIKCLAKANHQQNHEGGFDT